MNSFRRTQLIESSIFEYTHALVVVLCYVGVLVYRVCVSRAQVNLHARRRKWLVVITITIASSHLAEAVYYAIRHDPSVPQPTMFNAISTAIVWTAMALTLLSKEPCLLAYIGAIASDGLFQAVLFVFFRRWYGIRVGTSAALVSYVWHISHLSRRQDIVEEETLPLITNSGPGPGEHQISTWPAFKKFILPCLRPKDDGKFTFYATVRFTILLAGRFINMAIPRQLGIVTDKIVPQSGIMPWKDIATLAGYYVLDGVLDWVDCCASAYMQSSAYFRISSVAFSHIMRLSTDFHTHENSASINKSIEQAQSLATIVDEVCFSLAPTLLDIAVALGYFVPMFGVYMALIVVSFILFYGLIGYLAMEWTRPKRTQWAESARKATHTSTESLRLHETVTSFNEIISQCTRFERDLTAIVENYLDFSYFLAIQQFLQDLTSDQSLVLGCAFVIWNIVCRSSSIGSFVSFLSYWKNITGSIKRILNSYRSISIMLADAEKILELLLKRPSVLDEGKGELRPCRGEINFRNVSYSPDSKAVLKDITFTAEANQTTAIVGLSGSGKTTILRLILRLFEPNNGEILIDGHNVSSISLSSLREVIGMVHQDPALFSGSIAENVRLGQNFSQTEIEMACKKACIHDTIKSLQDGYESMVGEGGICLSGGQRQRIALARIIVRDPPIILLDEATSGVDNITEREIQKTLETLTSGRTTVIVAHRMSTVAKADKIVVIEDGRIINQGTHRELLEKGGLYKKLWETPKVSCEVG